MLFHEFIAVFASGDCRLFDELDCLLQGLRLLGSALVGRASITIAVENR